MESEGAGYCSAHGKGFSSHLSVAFDSLAAGKTGSEKSYHWRPASLASSPAPSHTSPCSGRARAEACLSEGRVPGDKSKADCGSGLGFLFIFHRTTEFETEMPTAKTWANPGLWSLNMIKCGVSLLKKTITNTNGFKLLLLK